MLAREQPRAAGRDGAQTSGALRVDGCAYRNHWGVLPQKPFVVKLHAAVAKTIT
jgi:hypothetical protein